MICRKHLATIAHFKADSLPPIPTPIRRKRHFTLPPPAVVQQVTRLAQRALRYSDLETLDAAEALSQMNLE